MKRTLLSFLVAGLLITTSCGGDDDAADGSGEAGGETSNAPAEVVEGEEGAESGEFSLLAYNVAGLPEELSGSNPLENMPQIGPLLNEFDVVLVQESWRTPDPNPFAPTRAYHEELESRVDHEHRSVPAEQPFGTDPDRPEALLADGLNRFSRFPFGEVTRQRWEGCFGGADTSDGGAGDCLSQKGFSVATHTLADGVEVDIYNLHAEAGSTEEDQRLQEADYEELAAFMEEHSAGKAVILGGDTNLHTGEPPARPEGDGDIVIWNRFLERMGLTDACTPTACEDPGRIDKVAFRSGGGVELEALSRKWRNDIFVDEAGEDLSDHQPLEVRFRWTRQSD